MPSDALTDRSAQGMTIPAVVADLRRHGRGAAEFWISVYVTLSRAPSLDALLIIGEEGVDRRAPDQPDIDWDYLADGPPDRGEATDHVDRFIVRGVVSELESRPLFQVGLCAQVIAGRGPGESPRQQQRGPPGTR